MSSGIVDTNILVDSLREDADANAFLQALEDREALTTHLAVAAEMLTGAK